MSALEVIARSERMVEGGSRIEGATPLEGHLSLASLLVREAVQNSWDARDDARGDVPVHFEIQGWDLDEEESEHLRRLLPVERLQGFQRNSETDEGTGTLHPQAVLKQNKLQLLVVADRRTVGLCGPVRSGRYWDPVRHGKPLERGEQRFANFVRNSGRAVSTIGHGGGGAFGVGKNALWMMSRCSTILIHSRTSDINGERVERFIGSIHGDFFNDGKYEYTGRHFVGSFGEGEVIDPLEGAQAAEAVRHLPTPSYELDGKTVDGTTIFIVAPRVPLGWQYEMERIRDSVRWQVWPKRVAGVREETNIADMTFKLGWNNNPVEIPEPKDDPEIRPYAKALLECARQRNSEDDERDHKIQCRKPEKNLGDLKFRNGGLADQNVFHVTLSRGELEEAAQSKEADGEIASDLEAEPAVPFNVPWGQIALVRRGPLLLVRYEPIGSDDSVAEEVGVFLSADDEKVEQALTAAEPAAHDDWMFERIQKSGPEDHRRTYAKLTIERIKAAKTAFVGSMRGVVESARGGGEEDVSRRISGGLLGGLGGGTAPPPPPPPSSPTSRKPRAQLALVSTDQVGETAVHEIDVTVEGIGEEMVSVVLEAAGTGRDSTGSIGELPGLVAFEWQTPDGNWVTGDRLDTTANSSSRFALKVLLNGQIRFRPKVSVMVIDDD